MSRVLHFDNMFEDKWHFYLLICLKWDILDMHQYCYQNQVWIIIDLILPMLDVNVVYSIMFNGLFNYFILPLVNTVIQIHCKKEWS